MALEGATATVATVEAATSATGAVEASSAVLGAVEGWASEGPMPVFTSTTWDSIVGAWDAQTATWDTI